MLNQGPVSHCGVFRVPKNGTLGNIKEELFAELVEELLGCKRIGAVSIGDKAEVFWKLLQLTEDHVHGKDAGINTAVIGNLITEDRASYDVHNKQDVSLDLKGH